MDVETATPPPPADLSQWRTWDEHQRENERIFRTKESWRWFTREHREELISRGALCFLAGRLFVFPPAFDQLVVEVGRRKAAARVMLETV